MFFGFLIFGILLFVVPAFFNYDLLEDYGNTSRDFLILFMVPLIGGWGCWYVFKGLEKRNNS